MISIQTSFVAFGFIFWTLTTAYQGGAPCGALSSLQPGPPHGPAETSPSPYGIRVKDRNDKLVTGGYSSSETYTGTKITEIESEV